MSSSSAFIGGVRDALVERQDSFVASHHDDGTKLEPFGEAHGSRSYLAVASEPGDGSPSASDKLRRPDEKANLVGRDPIAEQGLDGLADCVGFLSDVGQGFHFGRRTVENRDDPATLVLQHICVAQAVGNSLSAARRICCEVR